MTAQPLSDFEQIEAMTDREVVAFWNVLQFAARLGNPQPDKVVLVSQVLSEREIPHEAGKRTVLAS